MNKYPRGSEWRKWDLHIHSPFTHLNNTFNSKDSGTFIQKIKSTGIKVIGLTNYFKFSDKDFALKQKLEKEDIVVFLNLELRLTYQNKEDHCCDLHVVFDNTVEKKTVNTFLSNLDITTKGTSKKCFYLESNEDFEQATVEFDSLLKKLKEESLGLKDRYFIGFLSRGKGSTRSSTVYEKIANNSHFLIHSSDNQNNVEDDRKFWLDKKKPLVQSSDAHGLETIGKKFTWIKADPTFEGLKQIIYEPEARVRIQEENPSFEFNKPYFEKITIQDDVEIFNDDKIKFSKREIPLNKDLVTITGGRGTGKSLLINYSAKLFKKLEDKKEYQFHDGFIVSYKKENSENNEETETYKKFDNDLNFLFIEQSKIKKITEKEALKEEVRKFLGLEDLYFDEKLNSEIQITIKNIEDIKNWFNEKDENDNKKNSKEYNEKIKTENENLLATITTEKNKEDLQQYTDNIQKIHQLETRKTYIDDFLSYLQERKQEIDDKIEEINSFFEDKKELQISDTDFFSEIKDTLEKQKIGLKESIDTKQKANTGIKTGFEKAGYSGDLTELLSNAENYKKKIEDASKKIKEIEKQERELNNLKKKRQSLGDKIIAEYKQQKTGYEEKWKNLLSERNEEQKEIIEKIILKKDIQLKTEIKFDTEKFYRLIYDKVDNRSYRTIDSLKEQLNNIHSIDMWKEFFQKKNFNGIFENESFSSFIGDIFFDLNMRNQYIKVLPELTYKNKSIDKLSAGQKGTLYLRLQLATNAFSTPIIFDQPEDDLDNEFIIGELVPLFKKLKKYRQIILVTHNANIVVNADAEEIIVAENKDETLRYTSGAIEDEKIKKFICNILEGGKQAFEQRKKKYNF